MDVDEWNRASKGKKLPEKVKQASYSTGPAARDQMAASQARIMSAAAGRDMLGMPLKPQAPQPAQQATKPNPSTPVVAKRASLETPFDLWSGRSVQQDQEQPSTKLAGLRSLLGLH